jgi:hypothetical protein
MLPAVPEPVAPEGALSVVHRYLHPTSFEMPPDATVEQVQGFLTYFVATQRGNHWWIGDACIGAERRGKEFLDRVIQFIEEKLEFAKNTIYNSFAVAKRFPREERRPEPWVTFSHHMAVAYMKDHHRALRILEKAAQGRWTVFQTQEAKREAEAKLVGRRKSGPSAPVPPNPLHAGRETYSEVMEGAHLCTCPVCGNEHQRRTQ